MTEAQLDGFIFIAVIAFLLVVVSAVEYIKDGGGHDL